MVSVQPPHVVCTDPDGDDVSTNFLDGHMDTKAVAVSPSRRNRRHSPEFKARVIAACLQPGVSIAAVALANGLNANFLRSWVKAHRHQQEPTEMPAIEPQRCIAPVAHSTPTLVPVAVQRSSEETPSIELEIRRQQTVVQMRWPVSEAATCAQWLCDWLR